MGMKDVIVMDLGRKNAITTPRWSPISGSVAWLSGRSLWKLQASTGAPVISAPSS